MKKSLIVPDLVIPGVVDDGDGIPLPVERDLSYVGLVSEEERGVTLGSPENKVISYYNNSNTNFAINSNNFVNNNSNNSFIINSNNSFSNNNNNSFTSTKTATTF
jgi:hypothetical protein